MIKKFKAIDKYSVMEIGTAIKSFIDAGYGIKRVHVTDGPNNETETYRPTELLSADDPVVNNTIKYDTETHVMYIITC